MKIKEIPNYEGLYWASEDGSIVTKNWKGSGREATLRPATDNKGYLRVGLQKDGKLSTHKVHRLIAQTFIPNPENKPQVNHINGIKTDNRVENLEWCTPSENSKHAFTNGLSKFIGGWNKGITTSVGEQIGTSLLTATQVVQIRTKFSPRKYTRQMLASEYGVTESCIKDVLSRRSWRHIQ